ncbi:hypothetical protein [Virgibacillus sp. JSM 102003]|uniref:hypothetical protein n=1 Tax=Virgibacillus sp. JSM 102003 TaxID=1562108 RepID=UPI0035BFC7FA
MNSNMSLSGLEEFIIFADKKTTWQPFIQVLRTRETLFVINHDICKIRASVSAEKARIRKNSLY